MTGGRGMAVVRLTCPSGTERRWARAVVVVVLTREDDDTLGLHLWSEPGADPALVRARIREALDAAEAAVPEPVGGTR